MIITALQLRFLHNTESHHEQFIQRKQAKAR